MFQGRGPGRTCADLIEAVEPHRRFAFSWAPFKDPGGVDPTDGNSTRVEFTLSPGGRCHAAARRRERLRRAGLAAEWDARLAALKRLAEEG